jgi:hypothetical protein
VRPATRTVLLALALGGAAPSVLAGCGPDASTEARMFLDRLDGVDLDDPVAERQRRVTSLANLPLADATVKRARDVCVEAHRSLLEAEELHSNARVTLARHENAGDIPVTEQQRIERDIANSNTALTRARDLMGRCERHTRDLDNRFRRRRR